jgi:hypothetical protein
VVESLDEERETVQDDEMMRCGEMECGEMECGEMR